MNLKKTLVLAAVLVMSVVYLQHVLLPSREFERSEKIAFSRVTSESIQSLEVTPSGEGEQPYALDQGASQIGEAKSGGVSWSLRGVSGAVLDQDQISGFVASLTSLGVEGPLEERETGYDVSVFGLDKPALSVTVTEKNGARTEVAFGKKNEYLLKRYVKISGRKGIFLADDTQFVAVNKTSSDIRSKTPFTFTDGDLRSVTISSASGRVKVDQEVVGSWKLVEPRNLPASHESIESFLNAIRNLRVGEFLDNAASRRSELGLEAPAVTIRLSFREGVEPREVTYTIGRTITQGAASSTYVGSSATETLYKLQAEEAPQLARSVDELRERKIVAYDESQIKKLSATLDDGSKVEITASGVSWSINGKQSDPVFTQQYLKDVASFSAVEFPASVPAGAFQKPMLTLDITKDAESNQRMTVTIGSEYEGPNQEKLRFVRTSASDTIYAVRDIEAKRVVPREETLIERPTPAPK